MTEDEKTRLRTMVRNEVEDFVSALVSCKRLPFPRDAIQQASDEGWLHPDWITQVFRMEIAKTLSFKGSKGPATP